MEFRLVYQGLLNSSGNRSASANKHDIRRYLHKQLVNLWNTIPVLQWSLRGQSSLGIPGTVLRDAEALINTYQRGTKRYLPLVCAETGITCSLDILLLRRDLSPILVSGDLDGRIKTLIDGLTIPVIGEPAEAGDENPLYCLMSDDKFISEVKVSADHLFAEPEQVIEHPKIGPSNEYKISTNHVLVVVHVKTRGGMTFWS